jgi:hypothetical protein
MVEFVETGCELRTNHFITWAAFETAIRNTQVKYHIHTSGLISKKDLIHWKRWTLS